MLYPVKKPLTHLASGGQESSGQVGMVDDNLAIDPEILEKQKLDEAARLKDTFFDYSYAQIRVDKLISDWSTKEKESTKQRRNIRNITVDVQDLRVRGKLKANETFIPIRTIDTNIKREQPPYIAYLKQSRRLAIFKSPGNQVPKHLIERLEAEFTRVCTYLAWELDHFKALDGSQTHGWDFIEVCYDGDLPGAVRFEHVGHDNLIFPLDAKDIQTCECIIRNYSVTTCQLKNFVISHGFNQDEVDNLIEKTNTTGGSNSGAHNHDNQHEVQKVMFRYENCVYVFWYHKDCKDYLTPVKKLFLGVRYSELQTSLQPDPTTGIPMPIEEEIWIDEEETQFPYEILLYDENEEPKIRDHKGRVYKDMYKQEASCAIWSSFVNGCLQASNIQAAPKNVSDGSASPHQTSTIIEHGKIWSDPMEFFHVPYPEPIMLQATQALDTQNQQETNQLSFAVNNRKDSRKTAEEIKSATQQQGLLSGVQVTLFSTYVRGFCTKAWRIIRSQALQGKIEFLPIYDPNTGQFTGNQIEILAHKYDIYAAGDTDVIEREEKLTRMKQDWPVIAQTPLAIKFLGDILKTAYPDEGENYAAMLEQGTQQIDILKATATALAGIVLDGSTGQVRPEFAEHSQQLMQILQQAQQSLMVGQEQQPSKPSQPTV